MQALKILAVEHDEPLLDLYEQLLRERGHEVLKARNGQEAVRQLTAELDVVIVDLRSPRSRGDVVLEAIHSSAFESQVPVLIVDGNRPARNLVRGPHSMTLSKPFRFDRFVEAVESLAVTAKRSRLN